MHRATDSQIEVIVYNLTTNALVTGAAGTLSMEYSLDGASPQTLSNNTATELGHGRYFFNVSSSENDGAIWIPIPSSSNSSYGVIAKNHDNLLKTKIASASEIAAGSVTPIVVDNDLLNNVFGQVNIDTWADLDNSGDAPTIAARRTWAINLATQMMASFFRRRGYVEAEALVDPTVAHRIAQQAGLLLYGPRQNSDAATPEESLVAGVRKDLRKWMQEVARGKVQLQAARRIRSYPAVVTDDTVYGTSVPDGDNL